MEFVNLTEKEFESFAKKHPQASFYQTKEWGHLKEENGWKMHLVGLKDEKKKLVAAALLLSKMTPIKRKMYLGFGVSHFLFELQPKQNNATKIKRSKFRIFIFLSIVNYTND